MACYVQFQFHAAIDHLDKATELFLYRITQELLQNIIKHAQATTAWLMVKELNNKLSIIVEDNGRGFNAKKAFACGTGLAVLKQKIKQLKGNFEIDSTPDKGTTIIIDLPL